jgi:hypothetical protein
MSHTKGPWNIHPAFVNPELMAVSHDDNSEPWVSCSTRVAQGNKLICEVSMSSYDGGGWPIVRTRGEMMANANLIAAAPELLEALELVNRRSLQEGESSNEQYERIASEFYDRFFMLAPGKSEPPETYNEDRKKEARVKWEEFCLEPINAVRAAIAKAKGGS